MSKFYGSAMIDKADRSLLNVELRLTRLGLRPTRQRVLLADLLIGDGQHRHITAEELFEEARRRNLSVSQATVYNTLRAFCDAGLIREIAVEGQKSYFDTRLDPHPHFMSEETGEIWDAPHEIVDVSMVKAAPDGMQITGIDVMIRLRRSGAAN